MEHTTSFEGNATSSNCSSKAYSRQSCSSSLGGTLCICKCGKDVEVRTSWNNNNPGRRFRGCPGHGGSYCGSFEWVDPPMCRRAREVIPELLKHINKNKEAIQQYNERLTKLLESRRSGPLYYVCVVVVHSSILENPFALAYRWKPEPKWDELKIIFSHPDTDTENSTDEDAHLDSDPSGLATTIIASDYGDCVSSGSSRPSSC
ncbi:UNVERIFIED_CONTAM: hypothetical protein Slati_3880400 [Sesamum latifolium]|uniref:GRF-type domain-containing protein n=1 Tax=Sesamum latifolium TaxID=2727402 RepID=A0AAW2TLG7_9LAMI